MEASEVDVVTERVDLTVVGSALLRSVGKPANSNALYVGLSDSAERVDSQRPIILVPRSGTGTCVIDQATVRHELGVMGGLDATVSLDRRSVPQDVREKYHVLVQCPPRRKVPAGSRVVVVKRPDVIPVTPKAATPASATASAKGAKMNSRRAVDSLAAFLDEDDAAAQQAQGDDDEVLAGAPRQQEIDGLDDIDALLLPKPVCAAPVPPKKQSRKEDVFVGDVGFRPSTVKKDDPDGGFANWGEELCDAPGGSRWFKPHPHVLASYLSAGGYGPDAAVPRTAPILFVSAESAAIRTSMFSRGPDAFTVADERLPGVLSEAHALGYRLCLIASYPALDRAPRSSVDERLGRLVNFHTKSLGGAVPLFVAVSVASLHRRSDYTLPKPGLSSLVTTLVTGGNSTVPKGSAFVGAARPTDGAERDVFDNLLQVPMPDTEDEACANAAGVPFIRLNELCDGGMAAVARL